MTFTRIGFIGAGRLAAGVAWALARRGEQVVAIASRRSASAARIAAAIDGCSVLEPQALADTCDLVFITTSDGAIATVAASVRWRAGTGVVHCSGATEVGALDAAARAGAATGGFHPMQTFTDPEMAIASLPGCTITIEAADDALATRLTALAHRLEGRVNRIPPGVRVAYHASGGYASQFVNVLLAEAVKVWRTWGATEEDAVRALVPLVRGTLASIEANGLAQGMPGPISRGDVGTIEKHVAAIDALDPEILGLYRELARRCVPLAIERGTLDRTAAEQLDLLLGRVSRPAETPRNPRGEPPDPNDRVAT